MEELIIEDKKYVSTKQAAKLTGYAKDYVGQLCREGRVPARLVGRSWYVLASAIQDHRFTDKEESKPATRQTEEPAPIVPDFPRYEAYQAAPLPTLNRLETSAQPPQEATEGKSIAPPDLRNSWNQWFEKNESGQEKVGEVEYAAESVAATSPETAAASASVEEEGVSIPLHVVSEVLPHKELLPSRAITTEVLESKEAYSGSVNEGKSASVSGWKWVILYGLGAVTCFLAVISLISTGVFDKYIISFKQAPFITGVYIYKK